MDGEEEAYKNMLSTMKEAIKDRLSEIYPNCTVYDEDLPTEPQKPSFLINVKSLSHTKLLHGMYKNQVIFDVSYYSNDTESPKGNSIQVGQTLLTEFEVVGNCRPKNKKIEILENVLHFTFEIQYSFKKEEVFEKMQKQEINTKL